MERRLENDSYLLMGFLILKKLYKYVILNYLSINFYCKMVSNKLNERHLKFFNIATGILIIGLAIIIISISSISEYQLLIIHAITIVIVGIAKIVNSISNKKLVIGFQIFKFVISLVIILLAIIVLSNSLIQPIIFTVGLLVAILDNVYTLV